jgi:HEAT repeat protein
MDDRRATPIRRALGAGAALTLAIALAGGCSTFIGTTALSFLSKVRESPDPNIRYLAYSKLGSLNCYEGEDQKAEAARLLSEKLQGRKEPAASRAVICRTLAALRRPEARPAILGALDDADPLIRMEACRALGQVGRSEDWTPLGRIMAADNSLDCRVAAIESVGALKPSDPRALVSLVDGMEDRDPAIRLASLKALRAVTGKDLGTQVGPWRKLAERAPTQADPKVKR